MVRSSSRSWGRAAAKAAPAPDLSPADVWSALGAIRGERDWSEPSPRAAKGEGRPKTALYDCECQCQCGGRGPLASGPVTCGMCRAGIHHACGPWCKQYQPGPSRQPDGTPVRGADVGYIPERRACNGGRGG